MSSGAETAAASALGRASEKWDARARDRAFVVTVTALGVALRVVQLDAPLWYDEMLTLVRFVRLPTAELLTTYTSLNNHIAYSLQAKLAVFAFGDQPWALRLPALLFGCASLPLLFQIARDALGRAAAHVSMLLLAISYHHVWFSQNARGYTGLLFWALLATHLCSRPGFENRARLRLAYAITVGLACYTHLSAALFFAAQALALSLAPALSARTLGSPYLGAPLSSRLAGSAYGVLATLALYAPVIPQLLTTYARQLQPEDLPRASGSGQAVAEWKTVSWMLAEVVRGFGGASNAVGAAAALLLATALLLLGAWLLWKRAPLLTASFAFHVPLTLGLLVVSGMRVWPRYFFIDLPFFILAVVAGTGAAARYLARRLGRDGLTGPLAAGATTLLLIGSSVLLAKNYRHPKQDFAGALDFIESHRKPGDRVGVVGLASVAYREYYRTDFEEIEDLAQLEALGRSAARAWVVYAFPTHARNRYPQVVAALKQDYTLAKNFPGTLGDGDVVVFRGGP